MLKEVQAINRISSVGRLWNNFPLLNRKGFTLLPDYASTAFMMQGATVKAMFADCGDILSLVGLNEMASAYVALSRVKQASGLSLLRAFAPDLFRLGMSPGPECLLKLLRARFSGGGRYVHIY